MGGALRSVITERLKANRRGKAGHTWHVDETYLKAEGQWCYLSRAIGSEGNLVETMLSTTRNMGAVKRFFAYALETVTTDGHGSYPCAIRETLGPDVHQRTSRYLITWIEQDPQGIKQRHYHVLGFASFDAAASVCRLITNSVPASVRVPTFNEAVSLAKQRSLLEDPWTEVCAAAGCLDLARVVSSRPSSLIRLLCSET